MLSFTGRLLFVFLFVSSGLQKLQTFDVVTGGPTMDFMAPKLDAFLAKLEDAAKVQLPLNKAYYPYLLLAAIVLELGGGVLFLLGTSLGALLLLIFLAAVTPVMHSFWDLPEGPEQLADMINFFKNVSLAGALLFYLGAKPGRAARR